MIKCLPVVLIVVLLGGFLFIKFRPQPLTTPAPTPLNESLPITKDSSVEERLKILEDALIRTIKQVNTLNTSVASSEIKSLNDKITSLEKSLSALQTQVNNLGTSTQTSTVQSSTTKSPSYIPLGSGSNSTSDWTTVDGAIIIINPADYSGYKSFNFETALKIFQTGIAYARLYNKDDGTAFGELSTTSTTDAALSSGTFSLPSSKKTYVLQVKSEIVGYAATATNARIKVNF